VRTLLTPRWIAGHLLAIVGVVAFVSLGFWQLRRLDDRRSFNDAVETALEGPATDLETALAAGSEYRRVRVEGEFDPSTEVLVLRSRAGTSGHHVLTPLLLGDGSAVLVDRGWVPLSFDSTPVAQAPPPSGRVGVEGLLWPSQAGSVPDELPTVARRIDPAIVDPFVDSAVIGGRYLVLESPATEPYPIPVGTPELTEGSHLSYAVQWFLFAAVVVAGYPLLLRRVVQSSERGSSRSKTIDDPAS
jgi:cytochrome oxidase assembly protein ShyY1